MGIAKGDDYSLALVRVGMRNALNWAITGGEHASSGLHHYLDSTREITNTNSPTGQKDEINIHNRVDSSRGLI